MLLQELKKAFSNKMFQVVLLVSTVIPFMNTYVRWKVTQNDIAMGIKMQMEEWVSLSVFSGWIGSEFYTSGYSLFFFIFPLLVCAGYGWSFRRELDTGYTNQIVSRAGKKKYYFSKYFSIFITGGIIFTDYLSFLGGLFFSHPMLFCFLYLLVDFIFCGALACVCMSLSFFIRNKVSVIVIPFLALLFWHEISNRYLIDNDTIYTPSLLRMVHPTGSEYIILGSAYLTAIVVILAITLGITIYKMKYSDIL